MGKEKVHFETPKADRFRREITAFLKWFEAKDAIDPVLKAMLAHLWFVTIHPFEDGNGRIARVIADMALAPSECSADPLYHFGFNNPARRRWLIRTLMNLGYC